jgi:riboflavin kinase/FMN adenylyltransferase
MRHFSPDDPIPPEARGASIALGNFDGVHLGHQAVLAAAQDEAEARGLAPAAAVFEPHPRRLFQPDAPPFRLQSSRQRARALSAAGAQFVFDIRFDRALSQLSDEEFSAQMLAGRLGAGQICVGFDFCYGRGRMGNAERLKAQGKELGFAVAVVDKQVAADGEKISSSSIREAIMDGRMDEAARLLGRPWAIEGEAVRGFGRGRGFGAATANVGLGDYLRPRLGVYAVRADLGDGVLLPGVASVGVNPTVGALTAPVLETHVFDFDAELYGRRIESHFVEFLRPEAHFDDVEVLKAQMRDDISQARRLLSAAP